MSDQNPVEIDTPNAVVRFVKVAVPDGYAPFVTLTYVGEGKFVTMSTPKTDQGGELTFFMVDTTGALSIITKSSAHSTPYFGPLVASFSPQTKEYAALVVRNGVTSMFDRFAIATATIGDTNEMDILSLIPMTVAETDSVAGIGIPTPQ